MKTGSETKILSAEAESNIPFVRVIATPIKKEGNKDFSLDSAFSFKIVNDTTSLAADIAFLGEKASVLNKKNGELNNEYLSQSELLVVKNRVRNMSNLLFNQKYSAIFNDYLRTVEHNHHLEEKLEMLKKSIENEQRIRKEISEECCIMDECDEYFRKNNVQSY